MTHHIVAWLFVIAVAIGVAASWSSPSWTRGAEALTREGAGRRGHPPAPPAPSCLSGRCAAPQNRSGAHCPLRAAS